MSNNNIGGSEKTIFAKVVNYKELNVYQKAEVLVLLTDVFCKRFLPLYGDRRVDQMNMAARCGKQNIVEGCEDGMTGTTATPITGQQILTTAITRYMGRLVATT